MRRNSLLAFAVLVLCAVQALSSPAWAGSEPLHADLVVTFRAHDGKQQVMVTKLAAEYELFGSPHWSIYAGLLNHRWSVGELATLVLDTDHGYPGVGNRGELFGIEWDQFAAVLDLSTRRLLLGHRLQYVTERAIFGVSETTVLQEDYSLGMLLPIPILSYQISQFLFNQWSQQIDNFSNIFMEIPLGDVNLYGEFMVDHLAAYPWDRLRLPQAYGYLLGFVWNPAPQLRVVGEYSKVNPYTGTHSETGHYVYKGDLLGFRQQPDSELYQVQVAYKLKPELTINLGGVVHRKGEWYLGDPWDSSYNEQPVPSGVIQTTYGLTVGGTYQMSEAVVFVGELQGGRIVNAGHQEGQADWHAALKAAVQISLF